MSSSSAASGDDVDNEFDYDFGLQCVISEIIVKWCSQWFPGLEDRCFIYLKIAQPTSVYNDLKKGLHFKIT